MSAQDTQFLLGVIVFAAAYVVVEIRCQFRVVCLRKIFFSPFPVSHGCMTGSRGCLEFFTLNFKISYWQMVVHPKDKEKMQL